MNTQHATLCTKPFMHLSCWQPRLSKCQSDNLHKDSLRYQIFYLQMRNLLLLLLLLLPLALQPTVGFGLSNNVLPFFPICHQLSPSSLTPSTWSSLSASSFHLFLGLPLLLVTSCSWVKIFLGILSSSIPSRWPNQPFALLSILLYFLLYSSLLVLDSSDFSIPRFHIYNHIFF